MTQHKRRKIIKRILGRAQRHAFEGFFKAVAFATERTGRQQKIIRGCEVIRDVAYAEDGDPAHLLDISRPRERQSLLPVLLYIHGGGFTICSKDTHRGIARAYAHHGKMVVFNVNYRLAPRNKFPAALADACLAYRWIVQNAERYGGDPRRIVIAGESAGGNLALALSICASSRRPEPEAAPAWEAGVAPVAVLVLCAILQVSDPGRFREGEEAVSGARLAWHQKMVRDVSAAYLGRGYRSPDPVHALADPLLIMENGFAPDRPFPAVFVMVGTRDILLPDTRRLEAALQRAGLPHEAHYYEGEGHAFQIQPWKPNALKFWKDNFIFLRKLLAAA
ncbi:MAG: alpha/beta hydrolase [Thermodesulfobacteriota bacterium]